MPEDHLKIGLVMATMLEASPFVETLGLRQCEREPFKIFENEDILLIISGIGKANAATACAYLHLTKQPGCICNLGAAGALDEDHPLNKTYHIAKAVEPDRPCLDSGVPHEHFPDVFEGFPAVILATQVKPVIDSKERAEIAAMAQLADMEGASVIQSCRRFQTKCYLFKFVSDTPYDHQVVANIRQYRHDFCLFFCESLLPVLTI
jgi:nucleoside phosphorylase